MKKLHFIRQQRQISASLQTNQDRRTEIHTAMEELLQAIGVRQKTKRNAAQSPITDAQATTAPNTQKSFGNPKERT